MVVVGLGIADWDITDKGIASLGTAGRSCGSSHCNSDIASSHILRLEVSQGNCKRLESRAEDEQG